MKTAKEYHKAIQDNQRSVGHYQRNVPDWVWVLIAFGLLFFIDTVVSAQTKLRAPIEGLIKYEVMGQHQFQVDSVGQIEIYADSVKAFDITWQLMGQERMKTDGARILSAIYDLQYKDQRAILLVINKRANFMVPGLMDIEMIQIPHSWKQ